MSEDSKQNTMRAAFDGRRDVQRAVTDMKDRLPEVLHPLASVAFNYRWAWLPGGAALFRDIDPHCWRLSACNPRYVVEATPARRLNELARDEEYVGRLRDLAECIEGDLHRVAQAPLSADRPVAYFCSEFGFHCSLPIYGGGLGVLAGDVLKAASDLALPMIGVGLLYREGYLQQRIDQDGWQREYWISTPYERHPMVVVNGADERPITVVVRLRGRDVNVQVWRVDVGRVPLYLLDTDRGDNEPVDRWITARLYIGDRQTRLAQYAVLGIGGVRALEAMGIRPGLLHLNEGHASLSAFERLRRLVAAGKPWEEALVEVRGETVFTTHTPVAAGNEGYSRQEIESVFGDFMAELPFPAEKFFELGQVDPANPSDPANITPLALRTSRAANGVSRRHGEVARSMWLPLWPDRPVEKVPIGHVTNGVHTASWMAGPMVELLDRHLGADWRQRVGDAAMWGKIDSIPDRELWEARCGLRKTFVDFVRERSVFDRLSRGESPDYVQAAARAFHVDSLTIGFARRVATYKRLYLLFRVPERGARLLADAARPAQLVVAGKAHPQDLEAKDTLRRFYHLKRMPGIMGRVVFLENYDLHLAPRIVAGVDLWVNLPRPPLEASGTSGMKVVLNGGINASVLDGWWEEAYDGENGWAIATPPGDPSMQDDHDAEALLDLLEKEIVPLFYDRGPDGVPHGWLKRVKASMRTLIPQFSAERMLREYTEKMYVG
jgi:glycogen phosphorylase